MDLLVLLALSFKVIINVANNSVCVSPYTLLCKPCFLTKNSWHTVREMGGNFYSCKYVLTKNMQLRASACIPLYVQHFQVQGEREQTIVLNVTMNRSYGNDNALLPHSSRERRGEEVHLHILCHTRCSSNCPLHSTDVYVLQHNPETVLIL